MLINTVEEINNELRKRKKAVLALGCSFVAGSGALDVDIYKNYHWYRDPKSGTVINLAGQELKKFLLDYPNVEYQDRKLNFLKMFHNNAFPYVLSKKYLDDYVCINLGSPGTGSRGSIKEIYSYPGIDWSLAEELIVVYMISGLSRFDYANDEEYARWFTVLYEDQGTKGPKSMLSKSFSDGILSNRSAVLEQIYNTKEIETWSKLHKAKLVILSAFENTINKGTFLHDALTIIDRDEYRDRYNFRNVEYPDIKEFVNSFPWKNMFYPENYPSFGHLACAKEEGFPGEIYKFSNIGSPNFWVTPCAHPGAPAHDYLAKLLKEFIDKNDKLD